MNERWNFARFQEEDPISYNKLGQQFIDEIQINIKEINDLFCQKQFSKSLIYFTDITCQSKKVFAISLGEAAINLKTFLEQYMEEVEGIPQQRENFNFEKQREAALQFIQLMNVARETIHEWQRFRNSPTLQDLFAAEIQQLSDIYLDLPNQNCSICQHCSFCQLI